MAYKRHNLKSNWLSNVGEKVKHVADGVANAKGIWDNAKKIYDVGKTVYDVGKTVAPFIPDLL
jgi:hypothetical protein